MKEARRVCASIENTLERMCYDEYLGNGYPIATGILEGACRDLIDERMERATELRNSQR